MEDATTANHLTGTYATTTGREWSEKIINKKITGRHNSKPKCG